MKLIITSIFLSFAFFLSAQSNASKATWLTTKLTELIDDAFHWTPDIDTLNKTIRFQFSFSTSPINESFYLENFPSTAEFIDTSEFYNTINIGYLELNYNDTNNVIKKCYMVDSKYMTSIDSNKVKNEYNHLKIDGEFTQWDADMETSHRAHNLLFEITWLAIIYDTFSAEECYRLRKLLAPSLGAEYFDFIASLIAITRIINYS